MFNSTYKGLTKLTRIAVDAMGGDYAPREIIEGAVLAVKNRNTEILLVGKERLLVRMLKAKRFEHPHLKIIPASEAVEMDEHPKESLKKKDSSLAVAAELVKNGFADGLVSAGNTGAVHATTLLRWRPLKGISRPAIATLFPTEKKKPVIVIDVGANVDSKPRNLFQFAVMGAVFAREILGRPNPKIGIISIGEEDSKGNELVLETAKLLRQSSLNFYGNTEGRAILSGDVDIVICDGFVGNVILKFGEAVGELIFKFLKNQAKKNMLVKIGGVAMLPALKKLRRQFDYAEYGGAPLLGLNGVCIICHGSSKRKAICNAIKVASEFVNHNVNDHIIEELQHNSLPCNVKTLNQSDNNELIPEVV